MRRKAMWVTVDGTSAKLETKVHSTHRTCAGAVRAARRAGGRRRAVSAEIIALMQGGMLYTDALQALAGKDYEHVPVDVEV